MNRVYRNARVLTLTEKGLLENGVVVVEGTRIKEVLSAEEFNPGVFPGAEIIDLEGKFLMPGLINGHHHSAMWKNYGRVTAFNHDPATQAFMAARLALVALKKGVLALRDCGHKGDGHMELKICRERGVFLAPKIRGAIELIGYDYGTAPAFTHPIISPDEARAEVLRQAALKTDFIKVIGNNERMTHIDYPELTCPWLTQEIMNAITETAHMCGLKVAVHSNGSTVAEWCINAGVDFIEHGRCISIEQAERMAEKGIVLVPTLSGQKSNATPGWGREDIQPRYEKSWPFLVSAVQNCMKAGVRMIAGTDCLGSVCEEICLLIEVAGMSSLEAIKCATIYNAEAIGMEKEIGTVEKGKSADFIVVNGDPLQNPACLEDHVEYISIDGKWLSTAHIAELIPNCDYWAPGF